MKTLLAVLAVLCLAEARPNRPTVGFLEDTKSSRIMYGDEAAMGQFPHQLSLMVVTGNYHTCGAALTGPTEALTAAHCVNPNNPGNYYVRAGQHVQGQEESSHDVTNIRQHEDYNDNSGTYANDIAVLTLATAPDTSSDNIAIIDVAVGSDGDFAGDTCQISGWGVTQTGSTSSTLQYADTEVVTNTQCDSLMTGVIGVQIIDSHICVYNGQQGACSGDSGGPLTCGSDVAGVASWVITSGGDCSVDYPSVYTRLSSFEDWILLGRSN